MKDTLRGILPPVSYLDLCDRWFMVMLRYFIWPSVARSLTCRITDGVTPPFCQALAQVVACSAIFNPNQSSCVSRLQFLLLYRCSDSLPTYPSHSITVANQNLTSYSLSPRCVRLFDLFYRLWNGPLKLLG